MTTNNTNTNTSKNASGGEGGIGSKIKGAAQIIHGLGDNIRGTALGTADRATSSAAGIQKNADLTAKGRAEFAEGMARMKGHAPAPQVASVESTPSGTAPTGTEPADQGTAGKGAAVGGASGVTDQGRQQGTGDEQTSITGGKSGPESTGPVPSQISREAAAGAGTVQEQKGSSEAAAGTGAAPGMQQQYPSAVGQQEEKRDDRDVPERSQSGTTGQARARETTEDRPQPIGERSSQQQKADEQHKTGQMGDQQEGGHQGSQVCPGERQCEKFRFQGISMDEESEQPSQQMAEKPPEEGQENREGVQQGRQVGPGEGRCEKIRFQGISMDEGGEEQSSQQMAEKPRETEQVHHEGIQQEDGQQGSQACAAQEGGKIRFQDFQGCGV